MSKCLRCGREQEYIICKACMGDAGNFVNKNIKPIATFLGGVIVTFAVTTITNNPNIKINK